MIFTATNLKKTALEIVREKVVSVEAQPRTNQAEITALYNYTMSTGIIIEIIKRIMISFLSSVVHITKAIKSDCN